MIVEVRIDLIQVTLVTLGIGLFTLVCYALYIKRDVFLRVDRNKYYAKKTILITGCCSGIGLEIVKYLAKLRDSTTISLILIDVDKQGLTQVEARYRNQFEKLIIFNYDISIEDNIEKIAKGIDKLDVIFQNAGIVFGKDLKELKCKEFKKAMEVNCISHYYIFNKLVLPRLERSSMDYITISSLMGLMGGAKLSDYVASKHASKGLHESIRIEVGNSSNLNMLLVCPYAIDTGMFDGIYEGSLWNQVIKTIFPLLKTHDVVDRIMLGIIRKEQYLILPEYLRIFVSMIQVFPIFVYDYILVLMGAKHGMNNFRGHNFKKLQ